MSIKEDQHSLGVLVEEVRKVAKLAEDNKMSAAEYKQKMDKLNDKLDILEKASQDIVVKHQAERAELEEMKQSFNQSEKKRLNMGVPFSVEAKEKSVNEKLLDKMMQSATQGEYQHFKAEYESTDWAKKTLQTNIATNGGILIIPEIETFIAKKVTETSPIDKIARVKNVASNIYRLPTRTVLTTCAYEGETEEVALTNSNYGEESIFIHRLSSSAEITQEELMNAPFDMQMEVLNDIGESMAQKRGYMFVKGTGVKQPTGFMTDSRVEAFASGIANSLSFDSLYNITGQIKEGYEPIFVFNRRTRSFLLTLKDAHGQYLWSHGNIAAGVPNSINGFPYLLAIDMDDIGSNTYPIAYGDFMKGYTIVNRQGMTMLRNDLTKAKKAIVEFIVHQWNGAGVSMPEAIKKIKCATTI